MISLHKFEVEALYDRIKELEATVKAQQGEIERLRAGILNLPLHESVTSELLATDTTTKGASDE